MRFWDGETLEKDCSSRYVMLWMMGYGLASRWGEFGWGSRFTFDDGKEGTSKL